MKDWTLSSMLRLGCITTLENTVSTNECENTYDYNERLKDLK